MKDQDKQASTPLNPANKQHSDNFDVQLYHRLFQTVVRLDTCEKELRKRCQRLGSWEKALRAKSLQNCEYSTSPCEDKPFSCLQDACSRLLEYTLSLRLHERQDNLDELLFDYQESSGGPFSDVAVSQNYLDPQTRILVLSNAASIMGQAATVVDEKLGWTAVNMSLSFRCYKNFSEELGRLRKDLKTMEIKKNYLKSLVVKFDQQSFARNLGLATVPPYSTVRPADSMNSASHRYNDEKFVSGDTRTFQSSNRPPEPSMFGSALPYAGASPSFSTYTDSGQLSSTLPLHSGYVVFPNPSISHLRQQRLNNENTEYSNERSLSQIIPPSSFLAQNPLAFLNQNVGVESHNSHLYRLPLTSSLDSSSQKKSKTGDQKQVEELQNKSVEVWPNSEDDVQHLRCSQLPRSEHLQHGLPPSELVCSDHLSQQQKGFQWVKEDPQLLKQCLNRSGQEVHSSQFFVEDRADKRPQDRVMFQGSFPLQGSEAENTSDQLQVSSQNTLQQKIHQEFQLSQSQLQPANTQGKMPHPGVLIQYQQTQLPHSTSQSSTVKHSWSSGLEAERSSVHQSSGQKPWLGMLQMHETWPVSSKPAKPQSLQSQPSECQTSVQGMQLGFDKPQESPQQQQHHLHQQQQQQQQYQFTSQTLLQPCQSLPQSYHAQSSAVLHQSQQQVQSQQTTSTSTQMHHAVERHSSHLYQVPQSPQQSYQLQNNSHNGLSLFQQDSRQQVQQTSKSTCKTGVLSLHSNHIEESAHQKSQQLQCEWQQSLNRSHMSPQHLHQTPQMGIRSSLEATQQSPRGSKELYHVQQQPQSYHSPSLQSQTLQDLHLIAQNSLRSQQLYDKNQYLLRNPQHMFQRNRKGMELFQRTMDSMDLPFEMQFRDKFQSPYESIQYSKQLQPSSAPRQQVAQKNQPFFCQYPSTDQSSQKPSTFYQQSLQDVQQSGLQVASQRALSGIHSFPLPSQHTVGFQCFGEQKDMAQMAEIPFLSENDSQRTLDEYKQEVAKRSQKLAQSRSSQRLAVFLPQYEK